MNLLLFKDERLAYTLPSSDERYHYLRNSLGAELGGMVAIGVVNQRRGLAKVTRMDEKAIDLVPVWEGSPPPKPAPIEGLLGLPRPQTARRILYDAASLGIARLHFFRAEKTSPGYAMSKLWLSGEWLRRLEEGAQQGYSTWIPDVVHHRNLEEALDSLELADGNQGRSLVALDPYEGRLPLGKLEGFEGSTLFLALGPEGGWSAAERSVMHGVGARFAHLGGRILRCETAFVAGLALVQSWMGGMDDPAGCTLEPNLEALR
ncbi:MAG: RsmE family RNA methyltransferase [Puniceicoccaceae bacterium]